MPYNRYLLIRRWKEQSAPESIRRLEKGEHVWTSSGKLCTVNRVGIGKVLLEELGWVDWREIELPSAKG